MRLNVNLASHPYENAAKFFVRWVPSLLVLAALAFVLGGKAWTNLRDSRKTDRELSEERAKISALEQEKKDAEEILKRPENAGMRVQAQLLNEIFARKSFSWTGVLADLEHMLPSGIQVTAIRPFLANDGQMRFVISVDTQDRQRAVDLLRRMEENPRFRRAGFKSEQAKLDNTTSERKIQIEIEAQYDPQAGKAKP